MTSADDVLVELKKGQYSPIYFLQGEEPYYIDLISDYIEEHALDKASKGFNQMVVYGKDVTTNDIITNARRYPMMSNRQVVIVKEAQNVPDLDKEIGAKLMEAYLKNPQPSTILVFCYKYKNLDRRKSIGKLIEQNTVFVQSNKLYDRQLPDWLSQYIKSRGHDINPKALQMMVNFIGNDLVRLANETEKILINFKDKVEITDELVQKYVGISKEFNAFELQNALMFRNAVKAYQIVRYFEKNPKNNPIIPIIALIYNLFSKLLVLHRTADKSDNNLAKELGVNRFFVKDYLTAAKNYPLGKVIGNIHWLHEADLKSKGVNAGNITEGQILSELVYKLIN